MPKLTRLSGEEQLEDWKNLVFNGSVNVGAM